MSTDPQQLTEPATLGSLQRDVLLWVERNWPDDSDPDRRMTIITEEAGEVARCIAKRRRGTRGTPEQWTEKLREEWGDVVIALLALAEAEGFDGFDAIFARWEQVRDRDLNHDPIGAVIVHPGPGAAEMCVYCGAPKAAHGAYGSVCDEYEPRGTADITECSMCEGFGWLDAPPGQTPRPCPKCNYGGAGGAVPVDPAAPKNAIGEWSCPHCGVVQMPHFCLPLNAPATPETKP